MSWLTPIGFLGAIALIVLIIIYIIKPNYQQKFISSTFIWKLSLKYKKKKIPISQLRNLLIFICQILILSALTCILAQPFIAGDEREDYTEKVVIIDASASMRTEIGGVTRFERAVDEVKKLVNEAVENNGALTVILAGQDASYVVQRAGAEFHMEMKEKMDALIDPATFACTYGSADIDGAIELAEEILLDNPEAEILLYTGASYINSGKVKVVDISDISEWNAAILDVRAVVEEGYYRFEVDVAGYNRDASISVNLDINGVNIALEQFNLVANAECVNNETTTVIFNLESGLMESGIYSFEYAHAYISESDNFAEDNSFYLYGGTKLPLKVQYYSTIPNNFYSGVLMGLRQALGGYWDFDIDEVQDNKQMIEMGYGKEYAMEGYDIYIFEHYMPPTLPTDGLVILAAPNTVPAGADFTLAGWYKESQKFPLAKEEDSPLLQNINPENIKVTWWTSIPVYDGYTPLMSCNGEPVVLVKNEESEKIVVLGMNLNYSDFALTAEFPIFFFNLLNYFFPATIDSYVHEVNATVDLNARAPQLYLTGPNINQTLETFPNSIALTTPGTYTLLQVPLSGVDIIENFYVRIPAAESNTEAVFDELQNPYFPPKEEQPDLDLVFYFALALVCLLFAEWWLQAREHF
jgi:hypothetical protein